MKQLVVKLSALERQISADKGEFTLFALLLREDSQDKWDLLVSAPWLQTNEKESWDYIAEQLREWLEPQELLLLSRIILLDDTNPVLKTLHKAIRIRHTSAPVEINDTDFFGLLIKHGYIFTSWGETTEFRH